jgi:protein-S-isoprenylcysteine O-methyltransferase Ste14
VITIGNFLFRYRNSLFPFSCLLLLLPGPRLLDQPMTAAISGALIALLGQLTRGLTIGLRYIVRGGRQRRVYADDLVTEGMYGVCRNPMYVGNLLIVLGLAIASNSMATLATALPLGIIVYTAIVAAEEHYLRSRFGNAFAAYCNDVPRWLPRVSGLRSVFHDNAFHWRRVIVKEYGTPFGWISALCLISLYRLHEERPLTASQFPEYLLCGVIIFAIVLWSVAWTLKKTRTLVAD